MVDLYNVYINHCHISRSLWLTFAFLKTVNFKVSIITIPVLNIVNIVVIIMTTKHTVSSYLNYFHYHDHHHYRLCYQLLYRTISLNGMTCIPLAWFWGTVGASRQAQPFLLPPTSQDHFSYHPPATI